MFNSQDFDETVLFFMDEMGGAATLIIQGEGEYNYETSQYETTETEVPVRAIMLDLTLQSNGLQTTSGTLIEMGDKRIFVQPANKNDPLAVMPKVHPNKDRIRMGGIVYKIITLKDTNPDTTNSVLLELYVRQ